jgi:hypothetical protein
MAHNLWCDTTTLILEEVLLPDDLPLTDPDAIEAHIEQLEQLIAHIDIKLALINEMLNYSATVPPSEMLITTPVMILDTKHLRIRALPTTLADSLTQRHGQLMQGIIRHLHQRENQIYHQILSELALRRDHLKMEIEVLSERRDRLIAIERQRLH